MSGWTRRWKRPLQSAKQDRSNVQIATTPSAPAVAILDESGAHEHAICHQRSSKVATYQTAGIASLRLSLELARLAIVKDQFSVTCAGSKQVPIRGESYVSNEPIVVREHLIVLEGHSGVKHDRVVV